MLWHMSRTRSQVLPFETPAEVVYGELRRRLESLLIAAQTLLLGSTLVTDNTREFCAGPRAFIGELGPLSRYDFFAKLRRCSLRNSFAAGVDQ
jgi:hypothetical protein